ncbi:solute carrier family 35 member D3 isoform X1 [Electrophorus electricus]|uniref:solute carrier family 35 member D3 isoform X1 n=2 Tax=Electrophorus electricus TaxID=8005 RepID=UPI0015CF915A|nr:solute carrier family 35 member D3 isoform X1 [Electrophorus electricus]
MTVGLRRFGSFVCCAPALRMCVCEVSKILSPLLLYSAALLFVVLYSLADQLHSFVCGVFIPQYHYPYIVPLALMQVLVHVLALLGVHAVGLIHLEPFSLPLAERLLLPAVCGSTQSVLALWAESEAHSGLYPLTARLLPLLSLAWGHPLGLGTPRYFHLTCLLMAVTFTSMSVSVREGLHTVEIQECVYSPLSLLLHSLSLTWLSKVARAEQGHTSTFDLYYTLTVTQSLLLALLCLLHPHSLPAIAQGSWHSLLFLGYLLALLLLGALQRLLVDITVLRISALAAALLHSARGLAVPLYNLL